MKNLLSTLCLSVLLLSVVACSSDDEKPPLQGERLSILELQDSLKISEDATAIPFEMPQVWKNGFWPQAGGYPSHVLEHLSLNAGELRRTWSADIGQGSESNLPLTAQPVAADGRIFTLDTDSRLSAFDVSNGERLWRANVQDEEEDDEVIGGGISHSNNVLYVTNGYDEVLSVAPENGDILWRTKLDSPARAAPTILENRVFVTTLNSTLYAIDATSGQVLWDYTTIGESAGLLGAASPAANRDIVVPAFSSGEIYALRVENGSVAWSDNLSGVRRFGGLNVLSDIKGLPVIHDGVVYAISFGGRMVAIDERTGERVWQIDISGSQTPWVAGNAVFIFSSDNQLASIERRTGQVRWVKQLNRYAKPESRKGPITWTGPVLAGGRLILVSSDGRLLEVSPEDGTFLRENDIGGSFMIPPIVAGDTLYLLAENGSLLAYR
ncbi:MAG: PQQ-binding-like beta-propeller repeat protein [Pseudomonadota bacterium]